MACTLSSLVTDERSHLSRPDTDQAPNSLSLHSGAEHKSRQTDKTLTIRDSIGLVFDFHSRQRLRRDRVPWLYCRESNLPIGGAATADESAITQHLIPLQPRPQPPNSDTQRRDFKDRFSQFIHLPCMVPPKVY